MSWRPITIAFALACSSQLCLAADFYKGQHVTITRDAMLYLQNTPYRKAARGEQFEVLVSRPDLGRIYVLGADAAGMPVTLSIESAVIAPTTVASPSTVAPSPVATPSRGRQQGLPKANVEQSTYLVKTDRGQGSAFLVRMGDNSYLVTNYHVLKGARNAEFSKPGDSLSLEPSSPVEVATDRDLVRIAVARESELVVSEAPTLNQRVNVYGNPGGQRVITQESGKLLGIGPLEIEVSAKFIPGNSGGPIIQADTGNVLGVATYLKRHAEMEKWITNKTRFDEARRFGVRVDDSVKWSRTSWNNLCSDTSLIASMDSLVDDAIEITRLLAANPYRAPFSSKVFWNYETSRMKTRQVFEGIVAKYNGTCQEYVWALNRPIYDGQIQPTNELFAGRIRGHASNLGRCLQDASVEFGRMKHGFSTEYTRAEFGSLVENMGKFGGRLESASKDIGSKNLFQLGP